ncbi:Bug family tripartite tricarboxylate transporter substrate binding protein [Salinicola halophyticus]|uniref:Bug family tripartite tricarboxylate transporter substrate binding protein n=1 Tax=Salinicola halophyticus TaxID=1808881 RepID=UPI003F447ABC
MYKSIIRACLAGTLIMAGAGTASAQDFPSRGIEFVAGYGPGGGHDTMLRSMAKIIQSENISDAAINVVNKAGGSSAVAMGYLNSHKGDGHYLMATTSSFITTPLMSNVGLDYHDFTPIARLGIDPELLVVNASGPYQSLDDIAGADKTLNVGGTGTGTIEQIVTIQLGRALGKTFNYIPFQGDGAVTSALLSGQVDFAITNAGPVKDFIASDRFKALGITTDERTELLPDVPTFKEQGHNIDLSLFRGVVAAGDISDEEKSYLLDMVKRLSQSKEWKEKYIEPNSVVPGFLGPDEFEAYLEHMNEVYTRSLTDLGIIDK